MAPVKTVALENRSKLTPNRMKLADTYTTLNQLERSWRESAFQGDYSDEWMAVVRAVASADRIRLINVFPPIVPQLQAAITDGTLANLVQLEVRNMPVNDRHLWASLQEHCPKLLDVHIGGKRYNNAIVAWELEDEFPFHDLDLGAKEEWGLSPLPTAAETNGLVIDDVVIYGRQVGILAVGFIDQEHGVLEGGIELVSVTRR